MSSFTWESHWSVAAPRCSTAASPRSPNTANVRLRVSLDGAVRKKSSSDQCCSEGESPLLLLLLPRAIW